MRKVILQFSVSLDGYMEGPGHDIGWHSVDEELHQHMNDELRGMGGFLEGRVTWQLMADFWPTADEDPANPPAVREFAGIWRDMPKVVYSRTLESAGWGTVVEREIDPAAVRALAAQPGGDLVVSGSQVAAVYLAHDLVDEFRFYVMPIVLGAGTRVFPQLDRRLPLRLVETRRFGNGVVLLRHERVR